MKKNVNINGKKVSSIFLISLIFLFSHALNVKAENLTSNIIRHEGYSRDNVAVEVAKSHFQDSQKVILVNREKFPDAISATNISQGRYPVLYTHTGHVTEETINLLKTMNLNEIYILGGELSVKPSVIKQLEAETKVKVTRIAGRSRYDANVTAINETFSKKDHVVIASGEVYSDALYGVSYANTINAPVILTNTNQLEKSSIQLLKTLGVKKATIIGGKMTITSSVEKQLSNLGIGYSRIAGRNRYKGSAEVAMASYDKPENIVMASGEVFSDALVSAPLAQKLNAPILLVQTNRVEDIIKDYIQNNILSLETLYVQGGALSISENLVDEIINEAFEKVFDETPGGLITEHVIDMEILNQEVLKLINNLRNSLGVHDLVYNPDLQEGANIRAMEIFEYFDHARPNGSLFITAFGFQEPNYYLGENIALNIILDEEINPKVGKTVEKVAAEVFFEQFYNSPGHYQNMITPSYESFATSSVIKDATRYSNVQIFDTGYRETN